MKKGPAVAAGPLLPVLEEDKVTNFYVTYTMPDKASRDGYLREAQEQGIPDKSREEEGCIRYEYFFPVDDENKLFLWEQWESREHQKAHCQTEHFAELGKLKEKYNAETEILIEDQN